MGRGHRHTLRRRSFGPPQVSAVPREKRQLALFVAYLKYQFPPTIIEIVASGIGGAEGVPDNEPWVELSVDNQHHIALMMAIRRGKQPMVMVGKWAQDMDSHRYRAIFTPSNSF